MAGLPIAHFTVREVRQGRGGVASGSFSAVPPLRHKNDAFFCSGTITVLLRRRVHRFGVSVWQLETAWEIAPEGALALPARLWFAAHSRRTGCHETGARAAHFSGAAGHSGDSAGMLSANIPRPLEAGFPGRTLRSGAGAHDDRRKNGFH